MLPVWIVLIMLPLLGGAERFNCRGRILGAYYADAKSGCKAFHVCVRVAGGGVRDFRFFCPPGTLFHQEAQTCTDWGDDDPLACPADLYDGQFDLYKIGSGYDTKKLSTQGNRDEESEFGLQRAETGDRRSQNNGAASDLRTAHSSDFFSGQRDRGRDEQSPPRPAPSASPTSHRQSFRRIPSSRPPPSPTTLSTTLSTQQPELLPYESHSKRKLVRKRPIYVSSTKPSATFTESSPSQAEQQFNQQRSFPQQNQQQINHKQQHINQQQQKINHQQQQLNQQQQQINQQQQQKQQYSSPQQPFSEKPETFTLQKQSYSKTSQQTYFEQQNFNQRVPQKMTTTIATLPPPTNLPVQYKDEYVEVSRVAPIKKNRYYINTPSTTSGFAQTSSPYFNKKEGLAELYNYNSQSTPALNSQNENKPFKIRNSFTVQDVPKEDFARINTNYQSTNGRGTPSTADYNSASTRTSAGTTPAYKNFNSVSYEPEKNNFVQYNNKQNYFNSPSTTPATTTYYTTVRANPPKRLNTVAYNTNNALNAVQQSNFADNGEDDGQYRLPEGEDDGQYRPELYERELLTGAHSLNIAASGNRLPEDQKQSGKSQIYSKPTSQPPVPRPFKLAPTPSLPPVQTTKSAETFYTTTTRAPIVSTERTFDQYKSYTTTSRPEPSVPEVSFNFPVVSNTPARPTTTAAPRTPESRPPSRAPVPPSAAPVRSTTRTPLPPSVAPARPSVPAKPVNKKEDSSYDYAYYDSDPGFTEYDQIEEFGRTKKRT